MGVGQTSLFINQLLLFVIKLDWWSKHKRNEVIIQKNHVTDIHF